MEPNRSNDPIRSTPPPDETVRIAPTAGNRGTDPAGSTPPSGATMRAAPAGNRSADPPGSTPPPDTTVRVAPTAGTRGADSAGSTPPDTTVRVAPTAGNRSNVATRITPLEQAGRMPILPTSRGRRMAVRRGPINPVYILLVTLLPLLVLAVMVWAAAQLYRMPAAPTAAMAAFTPVSTLAPQMALSYNASCAAQTRQGDIVFVEGTVKNGTNAPVNGVYLKAFLQGAPNAGELAGSGVGNALGPIAPGASAPFTVTAQLSHGPGVKLGTPTPPARECRTVQVFVDQVIPAPTPGGK